MKKILLILTVFMSFAFTQDHWIIPRDKAPYYFYGHSEGTLRLGIEYIETGQVESMYELVYFKTYDSCFVDIYWEDLEIWWEDLGIDSISIINKIDSLGLEGMEKNITWYY